MSYEPDLTNLITELHEALHAATDPDKKELYAITLKLAKQVQNDLASLVCGAKWLKPDEKLI
jgi:hypothetical protein